MYASPASLRAARMIHRDERAGHVFVCSLGAHGSVCGDSEGSSYYRGRPLDSKSPTTFHQSSPSQSTAAPGSTQHTGATGRAHFLSTIPESAHVSLSVTHSPPSRIKADLDVRLHRVYDAQRRIGSTRGWWLRLTRRRRHHHPRRPPPCPLTFLLGTARLNRPLHHTLPRYHLCRRSHRSRRISTTGSRAFACWSLLGKHALGEATHVTSTI